MALFNIMYNRYKNELLAFDTFKYFLKVFGHKDKINVIENVETKILRFELNDYKITAGEKYIDEENFWNEV